MADAFKYRLHRLLNAEPKLLQDLTAEALGATARPQSLLDACSRDGRRSLAAEWLGLYRDVEAERQGEPRA